MIILEGMQATTKGQKTFSHSSIQNRTWNGIRFWLGVGSGNGMPYRGAVKVKLEQSGVGEIASSIIAPGNFNGSRILLGSFYRSLSLDTGVDESDTGTLAGRLASGDYVLTMEFLGSANNSPLFVVGDTVLSINTIDGNGTALVQQSFTVL